MTDHGNGGAGLRMWSRARTWVPAGALAVLVLGLVGLGARKLPGTGSSRQPVVIAFDVQQALTNFFLTAGGIVAIGALLVIFWPGQEPLDLPRRSLAKYVLGPLGILVVVGLLFLLPERGGEPPVQVPTPGTVADLPPPGSGGEASVWGFYALVGTIGLALLAIGRRARAAVPTPAETGEEIPGAGLDLEAFLDLPVDLMAGDEPRAQVINAYVEMIRAFARREVPPRVSETPREFVARALGRVEIARAPALRLTELFEFARFSRHPITGADADESRRSLAAVGRDLEAST